MNSIFKVTPPSAQLDIIQYTATPLPKPRRPYTLQRQEAVWEKTPLPDLAPNGLFDEFGGIQAQTEILDSV
jgi:hypothetical protein